jgi:preprotein translocase subunit YajC
LLEFLAQNTTTAPSGGGPGGFTAFFAQYGFIIIILVAFWFLLLNANRKRDRETKQMREGLKKGDRVQTVGGVLGAVVSIDGDEVVVKVDENTNTKIRFTRNAIHRVITDDAPAAAAKIEAK